MNTGSVNSPSTVLHISGIPGSGKSTYCKWLENKKGFLHLDFDELLQGRGSPAKLALITRLQSSPETFADEVFQLHKPVVIDWGFPPSSIWVVQFFKDRGFQVWWFDGDRDAAREAFSDRATVSMEAFNVQMAAIERQWAAIAQLAGTNIVESITRGPLHTAPEVIFERMFGADMEGTLNG